MLIRLFLGLMALVSSVFFIFLVADNFRSLRTATRVVGKVSGVEAVNRQSGPAWSRRTTTDYFAAVVFSSGGKEYQVRLPAGKKSGANRNIHFAELKSGDSVNLIFNERQPERARYNSFWSNWGIVMFFLSLQIVVYAIYLMARHRQTAWKGSGPSAG